MNLLITPKLKFVAIQSHAREYGPIKLYLVTQVFCIYIILLDSHYPQAALNTENVANIMKRLSLY